MYATRCWPTGKSEKKRTELSPPSHYFSLPEKFRGHFAKRSGRLALRSLQAGDGADPGGPIAAASATHPRLERTVNVLRRSWVLELGRRDAYHNTAHNLVVKRLLSLIPQRPQAVQQEPDAAGEVHTNMT
jgi:hypothetical protein